MALINCKECGREVSDTANNCLHCGYVLQQYSFPTSLSMDGDIGKQIVNWAYNAALTGKVKPTEENQHLVGSGVGNRLLVLHKNGISMAGSKFRLHYQQVEKIKMVSDGLLIRFWDLENQDLRSVVIDGDKNVIKLFLARYQKESSKPNNPAHSSSVSKKGGCLKWAAYIFGAIMILGMVGKSCEDAQKIETPKSDVSKLQSIAKPIAFDNVDWTLERLTALKKGRMRDWRGDEFGYISSSPYTTIGEESKENGLQTNFSIYAESDRKDRVNVVKLMMNENNRKRHVENMNDYTAMAKSLFATLELGMNGELIVLIDAKKEFEFDYGAYKVCSKLEKTRIDVWRFTITKK